MKRDNENYMNVIRVQKKAIGEYEEMEKKRCIEDVKYQIEQPLTRDFSQQFRKQSLEDKDQLYVKKRTNKSQNMVRNQINIIKTVTSPHFQSSTPQDVSNGSVY